MIKQLFLALALAMMAPVALGQSKTIELEFSNGKKKEFRFLYDDPSRLPVWYGGAHIGFAASGGMNVSGQLEAGYRFNDQMWADARYLFYVAGGPDISEDEKPFYGSITEFSGMYHYALLSGDKVKKKKTAVDYEHHSDGVNQVTDVFVVMLPRNLRHQMLIDGGVSHLAVPNDPGQVETEGQSDPNDPLQYYLSNLKTTSFNLGLSYYRTLSYSFETDGVKRSYYGTRRLYAYVQYGLVGNPTYVSKDYTNSSDIKIEEVTGGFVTPEFNRFGWRIGYEGTRGMMNSGIALSMGVEFGAIPHYATEGDGYAAGMFNFKFGVHIGPNPSKRSRS